MSVTQLDGLSGFTELLHCVLTNRLQQSVPSSAVDTLGSQKRLVHQQAELVEHLIALRTVITRDGMGCLEIKAAEEHAESTKQHSLRIRQQRMRPIHGRMQCLLASH